jgi:hypothetical protein
MWVTSAIGACVVRGAGLMVVVAAVVVIVLDSGAWGCDCRDSARTLSRESDLKVTLELEVNDMQYSDRTVSSS